LILRTLYCSCYIPTEFSLDHIITENHPFFLHLKFHHAKSTTYFSNEVTSTVLALPEDCVCVHMSMWDVFVCVCVCVSVHVLSYPLSIKRVFAYTHNTHLLKHIRKPRRKPHRHRLVPSRLTIVTHPPNFPCRLLPFNWLGDFSALPESYCLYSGMAFVYSPLPSNTPDRQNLMPSILARLQMILAMAPTFVSDKRRCSLYRYSSSSRAVDGKKSGMWRFDINVVYKSEICEVYTYGHIYLSHLLQRVLLHAALATTSPRTLSASRYILH